VGAAEVRDFLAGTLGRAAHRSRMDPDAARDLFGWRQLNAALAEHRLAPPRLRLERGGADVTQGVFRSRRSRRGALLLDLDAAALTEKLRGEATLIVDAVNELSPPLGRLCAGLSGVFAASCQANAYACWGGVQGFDAHWDDHDVFVVQLEGRKRWTLFGVSQPWPTRRGACPPATPPADAVDEIVLEPGDVLYMPRGYWHAAVGLGGPALHLTVGLTRRCGADFLHWLADEILSEELARADLPFEQGSAALGARVGELLGALAARDPAALGRAYQRQVEAGLRQAPQLSFPDIGDPQAPLAPGARVVLADGAARLAPGEADTLVLSWRGVEFTIAAVLEATLGRLLAGEAVSVGEIEAAAAPLPAGEARAFVRELIRRGVLVLRPESPA